MKYAIAFALAFTLVACKINHASDSYACDENTPCESGRICDNGFCVLAGSIDAPRPPADARTDGGSSTMCPPGCTSCNVQQKTCTIDCMAGANCSTTVTCPAGYSCDIQCNADNSCRNGINCQLGQKCTIACSGKSSCQNVQCGLGPCDVTCSGVQSCRGVACNSSCACDVSCTGNQACEGVSCPSFACRTTNGRGCTSEPALCHSCP